MESRQGRISRRSRSWAAAPCTSSVASSGRHGESSVQSGSLLLADICKWLHRWHTPSQPTPQCVSQWPVPRAIATGSTFPQPFPNLFLLKFTFICMAEPPCEVWPSFEAAKESQPERGLLARSGFPGAGSPAHPEDGPSHCIVRKTASPVRGFPYPVFPDLTPGTFASQVRCVWLLWAELCPTQFIYFHISKF